MKNEVLLGACLLLAAACGASADEQVAEDAALVAGYSVSALTMTAETGSDAAGAQSDMQRPNAPDAVIGARCVTTSLSQAGLRVDFGSGCTVGAHTYAGAYTINVSTMTGAMVSVTFDAFAVGGAIYDGDLSLAVVTGAADAHIDVTVTESGDVRDVELDGTVLVVNGEITIDGTGRYVDASREVRITAVGVHSVLGACYADSGTIAVQSQGMPEATVRFDADTPSTGIVTVTVGRVSTSQRLPPTVRCP